MGNISTIQVKTKPIIHYAAIIGGVCLLIGQKVLAEEEEILANRVIHPYLATQLTYDANVLRLPKNYTPEMSGNHTTTSSFIKQIKAGIAAKWQVSQQEFVADASINQNWFSTYNELNYTGHNLLGQWNWQLGQRLTGELTYNQNLKLGSFQQINRLINNLENRDNYVAKGAYEIFPDWYLRAGFTRVSSRYLGVERQQSNLTESSREFGLRYLNSLENMLGFRVTITDGKYPNRTDISIFDNAYTRTAYNIDGVWHYSVKTRIRGQIGYLSQEYKHLKNRSFSNFVASGDILWQPTRKSSLFLEAWREISSTDNLTATFSLNQGIKLTPIWTWSEKPKIQVELPISYAQQTLLGSAGFINDPTILTLGQRANQSIARLNLNYTPIPNVEMSAFAVYENRRSSSPTHSYQDQSVGLTVKVSF